MGDAITHLLFYYFSLFSLKVHFFSYDLTVEGFLADATSTPAKDLLASFSILQAYRFFDYERECAIF